MKSHFPNRPAVTLGVLCGLVLTLGTLTFRAQADVWDKKTVLTVDQPIQVQDTYLEPGTYVFKLLNSSSDRHIVQIFNSEENHLINTVMAIPNYRLEPTGNSRFTFYETPPGNARAMRAWFYPGDNFGQEFRYPKQLRQLAAVVPAPQVIAQSPAPVAAPPTTPAVTTRPAEPESTTPPPAPPQAVIEPPAQEEPVVIAQNTPPPAPARQDAAPEPVPQAEPAELPKTATPYPLFGFGGLVSLVGYALLRIKSVA